LMILGACQTRPPAAPDPDNVGQGAHFIRGSFAQGRQPDGNTVVLDGKGGLIVFDTGRHPAHTQKIIDYAHARNEPVVAIFNSHWHLDHISGNLMLRGQWPKAAVYSNDAALIDALSGFLPKSAESGRQAIAQGGLDPARVAELKADLATIDAGARLHPTVSLEKPQALVIAGRKLDAHAAAGASAGDVWLYDPAARLVLSGDLITLPAPFLDTACPSNWSAGLDEILAQPFVRLVPGHGRVMTRADVTTYRDAFNALIACAKGADTPDACADRWTASAASLQDGAETDGKAAKAYASYYVGSVLRGGTRRADCVN
ncbi:MAG TPA: MBL fold metallo-hydrolase, partial [Hyphomonadaceae bacterium]|nr:MBL fold metallo-hydrolase [Hyphomonadaceae bacterium]